MFQVSRRRREIAGGLGVLRVAHVDDAEALGEHVAGVGEAVVHHELDAVGPAALVGVPDHAHAIGVVGGWKLRHRSGSPGQDWAVAREGSRCRGTRRS